MRYLILCIFLICITHTSFSQEDKKEVVNNTEPEHIDEFFKKFVLLELGDLSETENEKTNELELYKVYKRMEEHWTATIDSVLNFPETIDVSIWDSWIKSSEYAKAINLDYTTSQFADQFIEKYYSNKIDVLEEEELQKAIELIEQHKKQLPKK